LKPYSWDQCPVKHLILGAFYSNGTGVKRNPEKARHMFRKFAIYAEVDAGVVEKLETALAVHYQTKFQGKLGNALDWAYRIRSEMPADEAFALGEKYLKGKGAPKDVDIAYKIWSWLDEKHPESNYRVAMGIENNSFAWTAQNEMGMIGFKLSYAARGGHLKAIMELYRLNMAVPETDEFHFMNAAGCLLQAKRLGHDVDKLLADLQEKARNPELLPVAALVAMSSKYKSCEVPADHIR
jgi:TPR repeat protein